MLAAQIGDEESQVQDSGSSYGEHQYSEAEIQQVALHLANEEQPLWSENPRLHTILRDMCRLSGVKDAHVIDNFVNYDINDTWLPILSKSLLDILLPPLAQPHFKCAQRRVCSRPSEFRLGFRSAHGHFLSRNSAPFTRRRVIGDGRIGVVDEVWSQIDGQIYARKVIQRRWGHFNATTKYARSFRRELKALKRIDHIHCVKFVSRHSYSLWCICAMVSLAALSARVF